MASRCARRSHGPGGIRDSILRLGLALVLVTLSAPMALAQSPSPPPVLSADPSTPSPAPPDGSLPGPVLPPPSDVPLPAALQPSGRPDASTTRHGIRVELWLSSRTVTPGAWLEALVRTTNLRKTPAFAMSGGCRQSATSVALDLRPEVPPGQAQTGNAAAFKEKVLRRGLRTHAGFGKRKDILRWVTSAASIGAGRAFVECPFAPVPRRLHPGSSVTERFAWYPVGSFEDDPWSQLLWPGPGTVTASWPFLSRGEPPTASPRRMGQMVKPIGASTTIEVTGDGPSRPSLPELIDIALADPRVRAWVDDDPTRKSWRGVSVDGWSGPTYEHNMLLEDLAGAPATGVLTLELGRVIDGQSQRGVVTLDPWTGEVLQVECVSSSQYRPCETPGPLAWSDDELVVAGHPDGRKASLVTALAHAVTSLPALLWPDAQVPESLAAFLPSAREQLWHHATDGLRLPLHLRFLEARCSNEGGVALVFEEIGRPFFVTTYAYAVRGSMPTSPDVAWGAGTGLPSVLDNPEFIHLMGPDTVVCP